MTTPEASSIAKCRCHNSLFDVAASFLAFRVCLMRLRLAFVAFGDRMYYDSKILITEEEEILMPSCFLRSSV